MGVENCEYIAWSTADVLYRDLHQDSERPLESYTLERRHVSHLMCFVQLRILSSEKLTGPTAILSYRAMLGAIVSQKDFVLVFVGYRTIIARYVAKWGIYQERVLHHFGELLTSLCKYRAIRVSQR